MGPAGIDIAYERLGNPEAPVVLLIMGVAAQSIHWPEAFCPDSDRPWAAGHPLRQSGFRAVDASVGCAASEPARSALSDMAADAVGLMDLLDIETAHVVGGSMGGAIGQTMAIEHPRRVHSLTSMMSTTGAMSVGQPSPEVLREIFTGPRAVTREEIIQQALRVRRAVRSPGYPNDEGEIAAIAGRAYDRSHDPMGMARQALATVASGDRTERLRALAVPTLVIHGLADRMCDVSGGRATAEAISGAEFVMIEEWDDLAPGLRAPLATRIADFVWRVEERKE